MDQNMTADDCVVWFCRSVFNRIHILKGHVVMTCGRDPGSCGLKRSGIKINSMQATVWSNKTRRNQ